MTWDWQVFLQDTGGGQTYLNWMLSAWGWTLSVSLCALVVALVVGSLMGIARTTPSRGLVALGNMWTELFRNIPLLVQIFLWYHVIPGMFPVGSMSFSVERNNLISAPPAQTDERANA